MRGTKREKKQPAQHLTSLLITLGKSKPLNEDVLIASGDAVSRLVAKGDVNSLKRLTKWAAEDVSKQAVNGLVFLAISSTIQIGEQAVAALEKLDKAEELKVVEKLSIIVSDLASDALDRIRPTVPHLEIIIDSDTDKVAREIYKAIAALK